MTFDWDAANRDHLGRHGITPDETEDVMRNSPYELEVEFKDGEERVRYIGETLAARVLLVIVTYRYDGLRVVTAWDAPKAAKLSYFRKRTADNG